MLCLLHATFDPSIIEINGGKKNKQIEILTTQTGNILQ